jgi:hypothetical protein
MKTKHTAGPWKFHASQATEDTYHHYVQGRAVSDGRTVDIALIYPIDDDGQKGAESEANALLIATAPELLAALIELCADKYLSDPINTDRMKNARAAIQKATGEA